MTKRRAKKSVKKPLFSHHKTSGKRLAHHHTHYLPLLALVLVSGFLFAGISRSVQASDLVVRGKVAAPLPPSAAVINQPAESEVFTEIPITVNGTCPAGYLVKIYRNGFFSGSVMCDLNNTYTLQSDLFTGSNELVAHIFNSTDDEGPLDSPITVTYQPPVPPAVQPETPPATGGSTSSSNTTYRNVKIPQMIFKAEDSYKGFMVGQTIEWQMEVTGGIAPYAFSIDWGDGNTTVMTRKTEGKFTVNHTYQTAGNLNGSYQIKIHGSDDNGQTTFTQVIALVNAPFSIASVKSDSSSKSVTDRSLAPFQSYAPVTIVWGSYFAILIAVSSFWFGETWKIRHLPANKVLIRKTALSHRSRH